MAKLSFLLRLSTMLPHVFISWCKWMKKESKHPERYPFNDRFAHFTSINEYVQNGLPVSLDIKGSKNLKEIDGRGCLFICNHQSLFDIVSLSVALKEHPFSFISKKENGKLPLVKSLLKQNECVLIDRKDPFQAVKVLGEAATKVKEENHSYLIFPEGTRNKEPFNKPVAEFKPGSLKMAYKAQCPIIPISLFGTGECAKKGRHRSYLVSIQINKPIYFDDYCQKSTVDLAKAMHELIQAQVNEHIIRDEEYKKLGLDKRKRICKKD